MLGQSHSAKSPLSQHISKHIIVSNIGNLPVFIEAESSFVYLNYSRNFPDTTTSFLRIFQTANMVIF